MWNIAIKDLKIFFKDKRAMLLTLLLPIALISLFAIAFGGVFTSYSEKATNLLVTDLDSTDKSQKIISELDSLKELNIIRSPLENAKKEIRAGNRIGVLVFSRGFADSIRYGGREPLELFYDPAREMEIGLIQKALMSTLYSSIGSESAKEDVKKNIAKIYSDLDSSLLNEIYASVDEQFSQSSGSGNNNRQLEMTAVIKEEKVNWGLVQAVAGVAVMMLLFSVAAMGASLLEEKEEGTLKRLLISPMPPTHLLFGKLINALIVSILQLAVLFIFSWLVFGLDIGVDVPSLIVMILSTAYACSSFGIFLASLSRSRKQVESMSTIIILVMSAIGGSMIPLFIMPGFMQDIAIFSVNYWSINGFYDIFWRQLPFTKVIVNALVLFGIGTLMILVSLPFYRKNILKVI